MRAIRPWIHPWRRAASLALALAMLLEGRPARAGAAPLTLDRAIERALARHPDLAAAAAEVRARGGRTAQQDRPPNPELRGEVENVAGSGAREGTEAAESTLRVAQRIELGGKRAGRRRVAELDERVATLDLEETRLAVVAAATKAFVEVLAAEERVRLAAALHAVADRAVAAVERRVDAGGASPVDAARTRVAAARVAAARSAAAQELAARRSALAAACGEPVPDFDRVDGDLGRLPPVATTPPDLDRLPAIARWEAEVAERDAAVALARAGRVPDVTVGVGGRYYSDDDDGALVFDLTVPLPVFDRNVGAVTEAEARRTKALAERDASRLERATAIAAAQARLAGARAHAERLSDEIVPAASRALDGTLAAHREGGVGTTDVLAAQQILFEVRTEHVTALETVHVLAAELARLTAAPAEGDRP